MNNNPIYNLQNNLNDVCRSRAFMLEKLYITSNLLALSYDFAECPCIIRSIWLFWADLKI